VKLVLFLCTGNYYRSRYAEEMFNFLAPARCSEWGAVSRGVAVDLGSSNVGPIARSAVKALLEHGVSFDPLNARMPLQVRIADLEAADHIVALKYAEHLPLMQERFASWVSSSLPSRIEYWHVHDIDQMAPEQALPLIDERVEDLIRRLSSKG
jgi:protein-tyrosine phosphatase